MLVRRRFVLCFAVTKLMTFSDTEAYIWVTDVFNCPKISSINFGYQDLKHVNKLLMLRNFCFF